MSHPSSSRSGSGSVGSVGVGAPLQFQPFHSAVDVSFWSVLSDRKLHRYKLDARVRPCIAAFNNGKHKEVPSQACVGSYSFISRGDVAFSLVPSSSSSPSSDLTSSHHVPLPLPPSLAGSLFGRLLNVNTAEEFRAFDLTKLMNEEAERMWNGIQARVKEMNDEKEKHEDAPISSSSTSLTRLLSRFLLLTFADLKHHRYTYFFAFPALTHKEVTMNAAEWDTNRETGSKGESKGASDAASSSSSSSSLSSPRRVVDELGEKGSVHFLQSYISFVRSHPLLLNAGDFDDDPEAEQNQDERKNDGPHEVKEQDDASLPTPSSPSTSESRDLPPSEIFFTVVVGRDDDGHVSGVQFHPFDSFQSQRSPIRSQLLASGASEHRAAREASRCVWMGFMDPSPLATHMGWTARNMLFYAAIRFGLQQNQLITVLSFRDVDAAALMAATGATSTPASSTLSSLLFPVRLSAPLLDPSTGLSSLLSPSSSSAAPRCVGWEKNASGKAIPRSVDLSSVLNPLQLASKSVDLNLSLMRWRALPALNLPLLANTRCLLLGCGTLGCAVARGLVGWGIRKLTLVDNGRVAYSNPVRQCLFEYADCTADGGKGRMKVEAAADALKRIFPMVEPTPIALTIPMPGHAVSPSEVDSVRASIRQLDELISSHDVTFLLTDSRESRWLPTLIAAARHKMVLNAALGFETYLVSRHGDNYQGAAQKARDEYNKQMGTPSPAPTSTASDSASSSSSDSVVSSSAELGCYFCNDVVAPTDSLRDRTLDQQCTVTRPGLSFISSGLIVELCISLLHHPLKQHATAPPPPTPTSQPIDDDLSSSSVLGVLPHQLRGSLSSFAILPITSHRFPHCTACNPNILQRYEEEGVEFIMKAINGHSSFLEDISGLTQMKASTEQMLALMEAEMEPDGGLGDSEADDF